MLGLKPWLELFQSSSDIFSNPDEVPFPDLLNSLLRILRITSEELVISRLKYCVVVSIYIVCGILLHVVL